MTTILAEKVLEYLSDCDEVDTLKLGNIFNEDHQKIIGAVKSLQALENDIIEVKPSNSKKWELTDEGHYVLKNGSHEATVYNAIPAEGIEQSLILNKVPYAKVGFSKALMLGWIEIDKSSGKPIIKKKVLKIEDIIKVHLQDINNIPDEIKKEYKKRKLLQEIVIKSFLLRKGSNFSIKMEKPEADLTSDILINDSWMNKTFKPYNFDALGQVLNPGHLHPLMKVRSEFRKIFIEMGFEEMPTNNFVESSFWNFDALFVPQQHPARDDHDTFYISEPKISLSLPEEYMEKVKKVHSTGDYGSEGYKYEWNICEAQKNILRTHTTAVSARMLYQLMKQGEFKPVKYFSIDRVFRNETLDATHLAEFHQIEGVIADYDLSLSNLIGILYEFFKKLGITELEFKPAYNPYTEPSMEIFCFHNGLGKWIELGNSGIFRPEVIRPMGLPENVNVIAWGLSLERPTMIKYGLNNIRDLVGSKIDLQMVYNNPLCRLDKHSSDKKLMEKQTELEKHCNKFNSESRDTQTDKIMTNDLREPIDVVILCDPIYSINFLEPLFDLVKHKLSFAVSVHVHSSISFDHYKYSSLKDFCSKHQTRDKTIDVNINIIWQVRNMEPCMKIESKEIFGLINIARYFNRFIESIAPELLPYESNGALYASSIDAALDEIHDELLNNNGCLKQKPKCKNYLMGEINSIVDIIYQSMKR